MSRKTTIRYAAIRVDECATHIQNTYQDKKYDVERSSVERRGDRRIYVTINNSRGPGGALLRGIAGVNVCGTVKLRIVGNDLHVTVAGKFWPLFVRLVVMLCAIALIPFLWPLLFTAIIGFFMQKVFLDRLYNDTFSWLSSSGVDQEGESHEGKTERLSVGPPGTEGQLEFRCPDCGAHFSVAEDSEDYQVTCPGCSKELDLTELNPL